MKSLTLAVAPASTRIADLLVGTEAPVVADRDGLVLMLYTAAQVDQGTGLCVVVQVDDHQEDFR